MKIEKKSHQIISDGIFIKLKTIIKKLKIYIRIQ
jgi:hypothetical protein